MAKARLITGLVGGTLLLLGSTASAPAAPTVGQMMTFQPRQEGVVCTTPTAEEQKQCEVKLVKGRAGSSGWLLADTAKNQNLRRFFDSNGDNKIDVWSYYKDGVEVYREVDTNYNERADQYRWLNAGGMKWGADTDEDGKIDAWKMISADEAAQEVFQAAQARDFGRLKALFISEAELRALKLPAAQAERILGLQKQAAAKFQATVGKLALDSQAKFLRVEGATPNCVPADAFGGEADLIKHPSRAVLYETADKKHDWIQTGEMIQVGLAWRVVDGPGGQEELVTENNPEGGKAQDPELQKLLEKLSELDVNPPLPTPTPEPNEKVARYNQKRVELLEQIVAKVKPAERETWLKQIFDNLSTGAQAGDKAAMTRLTGYKKQVESAMPGSNLAGYATFRELWAVYAPKLAVQSKELPKIQEEWLDRLSKFVQAYPKADDTADALNHLGMGSEYAGRDEEAKRWYRQLYTNFPEHNLAAKSKGCERRLSLIGQEMELSGPTLAGGNFELGQLKGKVVAVYYWASYCGVCVGDFARMKQLQQNYGSKGFELVCVNLDDRPDDARKYLQNVTVQAPQLFQATTEASGLNSPLATYYGINGLPTLFLVGRDGKVIHRTLQVNDLEDALKKAL